MNELSSGKSAAGFLTDPLLRGLFAISLVILAVAMVFSGYSVGPDDVMRWVIVQEFMEGQNWFDPYMHRLGPGDGTLMHWSRLLDAPIAAIYWLSDLFLPSDTALTFAAFAWPFLLAVLTLLAFAVIGHSLGGRGAAITSLVIGLLSIHYSGKFDYLSFDHHGLQICLFILTLMFFVRRTHSQAAPVLAGACISLSVAIGAESLLQLGMIATFLAVDWVISGTDGRRRTIAFCVGVIVTLVVAITLTSNASFSYPGCDALTIATAVPVALAAIGLLVISLLDSARSTGVRAGMLLLVAVAVVMVTAVWFPHCLERPYAQMSPEVQKYWLGQIAEAQDASQFMQRRLGESISVIIVSILAMISAAFFFVRSENKFEYALILGLILTGFVLYLLQSRMVTFLSFSLVPVQAQLLNLIYQNSKIRGAIYWRFAVILFIPLMYPATGATLEKFLSQPRSQSDVVGESGMIGQPGSCRVDEAYEGIKALPSGMVLVNFDIAASVLRFTDHSVLAGNYHRGEAGIAAQIDLFRSDAANIETHLRAFGIDYVMICRSHSRADYWSSASDGPGLPADLLAGSVPDFLEVIEDDQNAAFLVLRVRPND